jgi:hypothetical protein
MQECYHSVVISNIFEKKRNSIVTFQSGHLTEQPKTMDDLGCFDLKMFRNCPNINSKEREITTNFTSTRRRTQSQKTSGSLCSKLEVFI